MKKWDFNARRMKARRIAADIREHLAREHADALKDTDFLSVKANVLTWRLIAEALEEVSKLPPFEENAVLP